MSRRLDMPEEVENVARISIDAPFYLHSELGPGLLESVYGNCPEEEFRPRGIRYLREIAIPVKYRSRRIEAGFRADYVVEKMLPIELKAIEALLPVHKTQVITHLKLTRQPLGLLANFSVPLINDGLCRLFNPSLL